MTNPFVKHHTGSIFPAVIPFDVGHDYSGEGIQGHAQAVVMVDTSGNPVTGTGGGDMNLTQVAGAAVSLGQKVKATSIPVVLPSDQSFSFSASDMSNQTGSASSVAALFTKTDTSGYYAYSCKMVIAASSTLIAETSDDGGSTWDAVADALTGATSFSATCKCVFPVSGKQFRIRQSIYGGSGTSTVAGDFRGADLSNAALLAAFKAANHTDLGAIVTALGTPFQTGGNIGNTGFGITGNLPAFAATPTFNLGTLNGAATAAKQPALGIAGTASADVITVQGIATMTPLKMDGSGVTQPVSGTFWQATQPVSFTMPALVAGAALIGKVGIDQTTPGTTNAFALAQINAATALAGNGVTGTGSLRVTPANDSTGIANWGHGATGSAVPSGGTYAGLRAATALPTAASDGNLVGAMADKFGRAIVLGALRTLKGSQKTTITSSTAETTIVTAGGANVFLDLYGLILANSSATATKVDIRDVTAGTIIATLYVPAGETRGFMLGVDSGYSQTSANTAWTAQCGTSVASIEVTALYVSNK